MIIEQKDIVFVEKPNHHQFKDIEGQKFNHLTVRGFAGDRRWYCKCECGNTCKVF